MLQRNTRKGRGRVKRENNNPPVRAARSKLDYKKNNFFNTHTEICRPGFAAPPLCLAPSTVGRASPEQGLGRAGAAPGAGGAGSV